jgi:formylglycine-generating enzyme required for sulfatase activity
VNFTNSAGIELVWVAEGNFWIGKTEVTGKQYNFVINGAAEGSDEPKDGVGIASAKTFLDRLDEMEAADETNTLSPDNRIRPQDYRYDLPKVEQWLDAKSQDDSLKLGLVGLADEPHEWTSNKRVDGRFRGFKMPPLFAPTLSNSDPVAMEDGSAIALLPSTSSSITVKGSSKVATLWAGRLGLRVILIRKQP